MSEDSLIEIAKGIHLFIPPPDRIAGWRRSGNVIILNNSDALYIIDSGGPSVRTLLVTIVNNLLSTSRKQVHCVHTHGHIDHMAGARELQQNFDATIWASEDALPFVERQSPIYLEREQQSLIVSFRELFTAPYWFVKAAMWIGLGRTRILSRVKPLDKSSIIGQSGFHPIELQGHHQGHIGFHNEEESILVVGDLIDPRHKMKPILTSPSSDFAAMKTSLETVLKIAPEKLLPGHGEPILGEESIQIAIKQAQETLQAAHDKVIEILESKPSTLPELSQLLLRMGLGPGDVFRRMFIHSILCHLISIGKVSKQQVSRGKTEFSV